MLFWIILKVALSSLWANKLRSFLSILGIIIGVASVISMLAISAGVRKEIMGTLTSMGTNVLWIFPGAISKNGIRSGSRQSLKITDARAILDEISGVDAVAPSVMGYAQVKYFNENANANINGMAASYLKIHTIEIAKGRNFTSVETARSACVAILGGKLAETLFGKINPVGKDIRIGTINFHVIGVLKVKGKMGYNPDNWVCIPYTTAMKRIFGQDYVNGIDVQIAANVNMDKVKDDISALLRRRHNIHSVEEEDFSIQTMVDMINKASDAMGTFTILMGCIGSISLLVGGIGIMNIMLVTVTERTQEIGIRKAIGARYWDILSQFLIESILISLLGGILGISLGYGISSLIANFTKLIPIMQIHTVLLSFVVSGTVGVIFGFLPARRAARLDPIDALRHE